MQMETPLPASRPNTSPGLNRLGSPDRTGGVYPWLRDRALAASAILTWILTIVGLVLDHGIQASDALVTVIFACAYLSGGTLALRAAIDDLRERRVNVDLLMVAAAIGAATIDAWAEGALLLALFSTSNALEHAALGRTRNAVRALMTIAPQKAVRIGSDSEEEISIDLLRVGDVIRARPGERIAADGIVRTGQSDVDQSAITGESIAVAKNIGDQTFAGTINLGGSLTIEVTKLSGDSVLSRIVRLVEEARQSKSRIERATDRLEGPYTIGVIALSLIAGLVWLMLGQSGADAYYRAMTVLVVASPCALVIATPAASLSALANAARHGVLIKGGGYLDRLGRVEIVAFDKTGTLTTGRPDVTDVVPLDSMSEKELLSLVAAVERASEHPIARAIVRAADERSLAQLAAEDFQSITGRGVVASVGSQDILIGNENLFLERQIAVPPEAVATLDRLAEAGKTAMLVGTGPRLLGVIAVADSVRPEAKSVVTALRSLGVKRIVMLSGDHGRVANAVAAKVGITEVHAELLPDEKLSVIRELKASGTIAMIGDGINDAPALAIADVGLAMGTAGSDVALETADAVLMGDDLTRLPHVIALGERMRRIIRGNLLFAIGVLSLLTLTSLTFGLALPLGVLGHEGSTIVVLLSGLRLLGGTISDKTRQTDGATTTSTILPKLRPGRI